MRTDVREERIAAVRQFNRFFTRQIGVLREGLLHSPFSLTEARILLELGQREDVTASLLCCELGLDAGYLSRLLARLEQQGLLERVRSGTDGRQRLLSLTTEGRNAFALLDQRSRDEVGEMLGELSEEEQQRLLKAMQAIEGIRRWCSGPTAFSSRLAISTRRPASSWWPRSRIIASAMTWLAKPGS